MFDFFKKEKPFQGFNGFGGGAAGLGMFSGKAIITGGTKSTDRSGYTVHIFNSSGSLVVPGGVPGSLTAEVLCVGGGGGGGSCAPTDGAGGGGGAGLLHFIPASPIAQDVTIPVTVGAGGNGSVSQFNTGNQGGSSVWGNPAAPITAIGGGGGMSTRLGSGPTDPTGPAGGSTGGTGGGNGNSNGPFTVTTATGTGTPTTAHGAASPPVGWGRPGGTSSKPSTGGGAGGGARYAGGSGSSGNGGTGGYGLEYTITGSTVTYAGGGGGGSRATSPLTGQGGNPGPGGGGQGGAYPSTFEPTWDGTGNGKPGTANTGGGGGGGAAFAGGRTGGAGGSGVVIVAYANY